jgi:hypothetical protein
MFLPRSSRREEMSFLPEMLVPMLVLVAASTQRPNPTVTLHAPWVDYECCNRFNDLYRNNCAEILFISRQYIYIFYSNTSPLGWNVDSEAVDVKLAHLDVRSSHHGRDERRRRSLELGESL